MRIVKIVLEKLQTQAALPKESKPLRVMVTQTDAILWVLVPIPISKAEVRNEGWTFRVFYEGQTVDEGAEYIDSFSLDNGYTHRHLFKLK